ncbi:hypothetical protein [Hyphomonas sp.]|uniref:hypothetical protein n=1 Tax=Hyphomonas sp. TaxID=87 RepID=UPI00391CF334
MWKLFSGGKKSKAGKPAESQAGAVSLADPGPAPSAAPAPAVQLPGREVYSGGLEKVIVPDGLLTELDEGGCVTVSGALPGRVASGGKTAGLSFQVSDAVELAASGNRIRIHLVTSSETAGEAYLAYSTNEVGNSGWMAFETGPEARVAVFEYDVPPMKQGLGDFIGINPNGHRLTIRSINVEVLGAP